VSGVFRQTGSWVQAYCWDGSYQNNADSHISNGS